MKKVWWGVIGIIIVLLIVLMIMLNERGVFLSPSTKLCECTCRADKGLPNEVIILEAPGTQSCDSLNEQICMASRLSVDRESELSPGTLENCRRL